MSLSVQVNEMRLKAVAHSYLSRNNKLYNGVDIPLNSLQKHVTKVSGSWQAIFRKMNSARVRM